jgi:formylglycine-generating enzyme required for sulfatase activity
MPPRVVLRLLSLSALILPLLGAPPGPAQPAGGRKHALLVGVREYDSAKLEALRFTENDAEDLARVLQGKGGFRVRVLTTSRGVKNRADAPTGSRVRAEIKALLANRQPDDLVLLALAGHGIEVNVKPAGKAPGKIVTFFCPADAQLNDHATLLDIDGLYADLKASGAGVKLLLVDACRNDPAGVRPARVPLPSRGTAALFSCMSGERAFEIDKLPGGRGHGIFFHHVIDGLQGKAKDRTGAVTWNRLVEHVIDKVSEDVPKLIGNGARQTPELRVELKGLSPVLIPPDKVASSRPPAKKAGGAPRPPGKEVANSIGMRLVRIPAGKFLMGSTKQEQDAALVESEGGKALPSSEGPQHEVEITKDYWLGMHEVTQKQFKEVMGYNPSAFSTDGTGKPGRTYRLASPAARSSRVTGLNTGDFPVENVSWNEAVEFCEKLSDRKEEKAAGRAYRLPTEAQWEHACRAGTRTIFHTGDTLSAGQANIQPTKKEKGAPRRPCKVGSYPANAFGLFDMHGNVAEWCADRFAQDYYARSERKDPSGPRGRGPRVVRGGSWLSRPSDCRSAGRSMRPQGGNGAQVGFRVVLVPTAP